MTAEKLIPDWLQKLLLTAIITNQNFIEGDIPLKDFCATEVEPMFKESDHIHIIGNHIHVIGKHIHIIGNHIQYSYNR